MRKRLTGLVVGVAAAAVVATSGLPVARADGPVPAVPPLSESVPDAASDPGNVLDEGAVAVPLTASGPAGAPLGTFPCQGFSGVDVLNPAAQVMRDIVVLAGFPAYRVGNGSGDIRWTLDPYHHPSWRLHLHSLRFEASLLVTYRQTHDFTYLNRAAVITKDWIHDNPMSSLPAIAIEAEAHRTEVLLCLHEIVGNQPWLVAALDAHATLLRLHFSGYANNHGLDEAIALLGIGCRLGRRTYADLAASRIAHIAPALVDANGVNVEQSTGYQLYDYRRLLAAKKSLQGCGYAVPSTLQFRLDRMPLFIAHSTMPNGTTPQLGDTEAARIPVMAATAAEYPSTLGTAGRPPTSQVVAVYPAGYVFGRSTWTPFTSASYYSLRFGPPRRGHGHFDHTSMTWFARGRLLLTEAGHIGYEASARRTHVLSPEGHNVLTVAGVAPGNPSTALVGRRTTAGRAFFELADTAYGASRRRSVFVLDHPNVVIVYDQMSSTTTRGYRQLWHLTNDMAVSIVGRGTAVALPSAGDTRLQLTQVPVPGQSLPAGGTTVVKGRTTPSLLGWVAPFVLHWLPAPVVSMNRMSRGTRIITVIATGPRTGRVLVSSARLGADGWWHINLSVAGVPAAVRVSPGGAIWSG